jgi:N-acyl-phosphatidylethanolamine-hydrolysing phospholipase D
MNRYFDPSKPHHRPEGFQNLHDDFNAKSLADVLRWRWDALRTGFPSKMQVPAPRIQANADFLRANANAGHLIVPTATWVGHATVLVQIGGVTLLTDPIFSDRASPVSFAGPRRRVPPGIALDDLPHVDVVLISHNHYDHLDTASVKALAALPGGPPLFIVPLGLRTWLDAIGIENVIELDWWQTHTLMAPKGELEVMLSPARHWSGRGLGDRMATLWGGFAVFAADCHLFFAGDTGYSRDFRDLRERAARRQRPEAGGGFDLALIPIGAYEPRWFMKEQHVNVAEAVRILRDCAAKRSLGVHWGTFQLSDEALDEPPRALQRESQTAGLRADEFFVVAVGETTMIAARDQSSTATRVLPPVAEPASGG